MILKICVALVLLIAAILILAATRPDTFQIQRSITVNAPPEKVFALIDDFHNWSQWAPQDKEDPSMKRSYSGPVSGIGAESKWQGAGSTGQGTMRIVKSLPFQSVIVKVDFEKPFVAHNSNEFTLISQGTRTTVTWSMQGTNVYMTKVMSIFTNMDRMMGKHFETGLANLKAAAEQQ